MTQQVARKTEQYFKCARSLFYVCRDTVLPDGRKLLQEKLAGPFTDPDETCDERDRIHAADPSLNAYCVECVYFDAGRRNQSHV